MTVTTRPPAGVPRYDADLFTDEALDDPYPHLRALRDAGPVVWLDTHDMYAVARYDDVRRVLADHDTFVSGEGVALNDLERVDTIALDGPPVRKRNNLIRSFRSLPVTVAPTGAG